MNVQAASLHLLVTPHTPTQRPPSLLLLPNLFSESNIYSVQRLFPQQCVIDGYGMSVVMNTCGEWPWFPIMFLGK